MKKAEGMLEKKEIEKVIADHGWQSIFVAGSEQSDCFIYSIGFEESFNHPEIIFFDYGAENSHSLMSHIAELIKSGRRMKMGVYSDILTTPYKALFIEMNEEVKKEHLLLADKYYDTTFRAMLMALSDEAGIFPHEANYGLKDQRDVVGILAQMGGG